MNTATQQAPAPAANQASVEGMRQLAPRQQQQEQDYAIDFFSAKGFELAQRLAKAFATSTAVPVAFRALVEKRIPGGGFELVENPAAIGNCLIAIETARAVGVSITSVMQNANVIEGRLSWSAQFKIAAINASKRFTPLRFDVKNMGVLKAKYREKLGWNKPKGGFDFKDVEVEVENLVCIAWALPGGMSFPPGVNTYDDAKAAKLPVIESAPVSMKLAVEEGWYGKSGSKWQTEMKHLMLQYRAGSFFGNIHAPDVVMGMGRTTDELEDITTIDVNREGNVTAITTEQLARPPAQKADVVQYVSQVNTIGSGEEQAPEGQEQKPAANLEGAAAAAEQALEQMVDEVMTYAKVADMLVKATTAIEVDAARALIPRIEDAMQQAELNAMATRRTGELSAPAAKTTTRRTGTAKPSVE